MAKRNPAQEEDFGFVPLSEDIPFTPEEEMAAGEKMGAAAIPTMKSKEEDFGFVPYAPEVFDPGESVSLEEIGQTASDVVTTAPQGVTTWMDEIQAGLQAGGKKIFGAEEPLMDIYDQDVAEIRQNIGAARERSPWATAIGETGTSIGTALLPGALAAKGIGGLGKVANTVAAGKFGGVGGMAARGFVEGAGTAETMDPYEAGTFGLMGAAAGGIGGVATKGIKAITTQSPARIRAGVLGAKTSQFKEIGIKEREKIAKELGDMGLYQKTKTSFDPDKGKWIPTGSALENIEKPTRDKLVERVDDAFDTTQVKKMKALGADAEKIIDQENLEKELDKVVTRYSKKRTGRDERVALATKVKLDIIDDILADIEDEKLQGMNVRLLESAKQRLKDDVVAYGKDPLTSKIPDAAILYNDMYSTINKILRSEIEDPNYAKLNDIQSKLFTVKGDLKNAIAAESPNFNPMDFNTWFKSPEAQLDISRAAEIMNTPGLKQLKRPLRMGTAEAPFGAIRYLDPSIPDQNQRPMPLINFSPREIIDYRIPRSTNGILEDKEKVLAKFVQKGLPDEMVETLTVALNGNPDDLSDIMPLIMTQFPEAFEKSKYKVFDGRFIDPNDKARAADSISRREDINSIQRAKMISKINKTGEVPEGMV